MKATVAVICASSLLLLAGCAGASDEAKAHNGCVEDAKQQLPSGAERVDTSKLETSNMTQAMREAIDNPLPPDPEDGVLWSTTGDIWFRTDGGDKHASVLCLTELKDGEPTEPIEAILTF